jgi:hypothetical protein
MTLTFLTMPKVVALSIAVAASLTVIVTQALGLVSKR